MIWIHEISNFLSLLFIPAASHVSSQWVWLNYDDVAHCNFSWMRITFDLLSMVGDHDMIHPNQSCHYIFSSAIFINFGYYSVSTNTCLCLVEKLCTIVLVRVILMKFYTSAGEGTGLLRLHSTYRHDLKIYSSDEGRVQV